MSRRINSVNNLLVHQYGDEAVVLNLNNETYYSFNGVAMRMWQVLTSNPSVEQALQVLQAEYEVDETVLRSDLDAFIQQLESMNLVEVAD
jgi:hypothetical protein